MLQCVAVCCIIICEAAQMHQIIRLFCKRALWKRRYSYVLYVRLHLSCMPRTCIHVYVNLCVHVYMYMWIHAYMYTCIYEFMCKCIHVYVNSCVHVFMCMWIHVYMYSCVLCVRLHLWHDRCSVTHNTYEYRLFHRALLQKRRIILRSLLIVAIPYHTRQMQCHT